MTPKSFDLNLLTVLDALISERNVMRAGQQLSRSQPAISNALRRLRDVLDDDLLVRGPNGMLLTPRAEALREPLREIVTLIDERILQEASFDPALASGVCRICMPDRLALAVVPPLSGAPVEDGARHGFAFDNGRPPPCSRIAGAGPG